jgi:hypothetical protein
MFMECEIRRESKEAVLVCFKILAKNFLLFTLRQERTEAV